MSSHAPSTALARRNSGQPAGPPGAGGLQGKVGKHRIARPDLAHVLAPAGGLAEHVLLPPAVVNRVTRLALHAGVHNRHGADAGGLQVPVQGGGIGKIHPVPGKQPVVVHVVDVVPQGADRDVGGGELGGQFPEFRLVLIAPAALVIAQRPQRRQRRSTGQCRVAPDDLRQTGTGEEIQVGIAAQRLIPELARLELAGIQDRPAGIVEKQPQKPLAAFENGEGNGDVGGVVIIAGVGVAKHRNHVHGQAVGAVAELVETLGALAEAVATVHRRDGEIEQQRLAARADALGDRRQNEAGQFQPQGGRAEFDSARLRREHRRFRFQPGRDWPAGPPVRQHRVRMLARVGDGGVRESQPQATGENVGGAHPQPDARPGQFDLVAFDDERIGEIEIERMDFLAEEHGERPGKWKKQSEPG